MTSLAPSRINAFMLGLDHALWWNYQDPANERHWIGEHKNGGSWAFEPVAISSTLNHLSAFMVDSNNHSLHQANFDLVQWGDFGPWKNLGGQTIAPPAVANREGTLHIFHVGTDHAIYHKSWDGMTYTPAEGFEKLAGVFLHAPATVRTGEEEVSVFAVGLKDGSLYRYNWESSTGWLPVQKLPGDWFGTPVAISDKKGNWDVFGLDIQGRINHISSRRGEVSKLKTIPGSFKGIDAVSWGPGRIDLFGWAFNSSIFHKTWEDESWGGWEDMNFQSASIPKAVCHSPGSLAVLTTRWSLPSLTVNHRNKSNGEWMGWLNLGGLYFGRAG